MPDEDRLIHELSGNFNIDIRDNKTINFLIDNHYIKPTELLNRDSPLGDLSFIVLAPFKLKSNMFDYNYCTGETGSLLCYTSKLKCDYNLC